MNNRTFVLAWVEAYKKKTGVPSVASKLNLSVSTVSARANYLRTQGVNLPKMPKRQRLDMSIEDLNQLIESRI